MALPYEVIRVIEEAVQDPEKAARVIRAIEEGLGAIRKEALAQKEVVKAELKDELTKELATKADLAEILARLERMEEALRHTASREDVIRLEIWLKVLAGIMLAGFTIFNPGFQQFIRTLFTSLGG